MTAPGNFAAAATLRGTHICVPYNLPEGSQGRLYRPFSGHAQGGVPSPRRGGLGAGRPTIFMEDVRWLTGRRKRRPLQLQFFLKFLLDNRSISCYIVSVS